MFSEISEEDVEYAKEFINSDNKDKKKDLTNILTQNGINEKNPFDPDVISNSVNVSFDIYKKEIEIFVTAYERTKRLFEEIQADDVKLDKHRKLINDSNSKLHFLAAKKDYIVGFLDNERIAEIYDKKIHRKLMLEACRNLNDDLVHIDSLYDILLKEIASRASKRLYKENYDKSYLLNIEKVSEDVGEEINKLKANAVAVVNLNYWRIDGISRIQDVFEKDVKEIYGRDLDEIFPKPEENETMEEPKVEESKNEAVEIKTVENDMIKEDARKKAKYKKLKSSKDVLKNAINKVQSKNNIVNDTVVEENSKVDESENINYQEDNIDYNNLFEKISMLDEIGEETSKSLEDNIDSKPKEILSENNVNNAENDNVTLAETVKETIEKVEDENKEENAENNIENTIENIKEENIDENNEEKALNENEENNIEKNINEDENSDNEIEESIFDYYYKDLGLDVDERKRKMRDQKKLNKDNKKSNIFRKLMGFNSKKQKEA